MRGEKQPEQMKGEKMMMLYVSTIYVWFATGISNKNFVASKQRAVILADPTS